MKRRIISAIVILLFFSQHLQAQDFYEDVIYLKNGSVFRGMIFEIVPGKSMSIEAENHFVYTFPYEKIERIRKEPRQSISTSTSISISTSTSPSPSSSDAKFAVPHYTDIVQIGMLTWRAHPLATFGFVRCAAAGDYTMLGFGMGWDAYDNGTMLPMFLDARTVLLPGQASPFVFADVGYSLGLLKHRNVWDAGGVTLRAGAGFTVPSSTGASFVMQIAYRMQKATVIESGIDYGMYGYQFQPYSRKSNVTAEFVAVTVGIGF